MAVQWLGLSAFTALAPGSTLVGELRSYKPHGMTKKTPKNNYSGGFPGGAVVGNLPVNAGVHGFELPHAAEQLGPWATTAEPVRLEPVLRNERGRDSERPAHRDEEWPPLAATRESTRAETKT